MLVVVVLLLNLYLFFMVKPNGLTNGIDYLSSCLAFFKHFHDLRSRKNEMHFIKKV